MAKPPKKPRLEDIETDPGAWGRFEHAVDAAVKSGPKHRKSPAPKPRSVKRRLLKPKRRATSAAS